MPQMFCQLLLTIATSLATGLVGVSNPVSASDSVPNLQTEQQASAKTLRLLGVVDYHGAGIAHVPKLMAAAGEKILYHQIGNVHSTIIDEWTGRADSRRGCEPYITGKAEQPHSSQIKRHKDRIAKGKPPKLLPELKKSDTKEYHRQKKEHAQYNHARRALNRLEFIKAKPDIVVFSAGSWCGFLGKSDKSAQWVETLPEVVRSFSALTKKHGARPILVSTMAWHAQSRLPQIERDLTRMDAGYRKLLAEAPIEFVPAHLAFAKAYRAATTEGSPLAGFSACTDRHAHVDQRCAYLYGCCIYAVLTGKSPVGIALPKISYVKYNPGAKRGDPRQNGLVTIEQGRLLQQLAWEAVEEWNSRKTSEIQK